MILLRYGYLNDMLQERQLPLAVPIAVGVGLAVALASVIAMVPVRQPVSDNVTVAAKADRPPVAIDHDTIMVRTIPISRLPTPTVVAPAVLPDPVPQAPPELAQHIMPVAPPVHTDICKRHGGYRQVTGRSWRCVYTRGERRL